MNVIRTPEPIIVAIGFVPIIGVMVSSVLYPSYIGVQSFLVAFLGSMSFILSIYGFSWLFGIKSVQRKLPIVFMAKEKSSFILSAICLISMFGTASLVNTFVENFGFDSLFRRPDLFQRNSIVNYYGYLLYLNVFIFSLFSITEQKSALYRLVYVVIFIISVLSLIFSGNKSYLFQALLLYMLVKSKGNIGSSAKILLIFIGIIVFLFALYDEYIDLVDSQSVFDRPLIYIFGGWATLQSFIDSGGYSAVYVGDHLFYPIIKVLTYGSFPEESLFKFYDVDGFDLNQFSIFGSAFLDFWYLGVIAVGFFLGAVEYFLRVARYSRESDIWTIIYWYFVAELLLSFFFANMFGSLYVYTSVMIILIINFAYHIFFKRVLSPILRRASGLPH